MKFTTVITAVALAASSTPAFAIGGYEPTSIWIHPKEPTAVVFNFGGIATENAFIEARYTEETIKDWCENWMPGREDCLKSPPLNLPNEDFRVSANCRTGELSDPYGGRFKFSGIFAGNDLFDRAFEFTDQMTGKVVQQNNADGGRVLAGFWADLCPLGAPYDILPVEQVVNRSKEYPQLRGEYDVSGAMFIAHNGSQMTYDPSLGIISYTYPKNKRIEPDTVLFRGSITPNGSVHGMAYTFKKGCDPAPYYVSGYDEGTETLTLKGKAPIREGCEVVGYTEDSPNAKLEFTFHE